MAITCLTPAVWDGGFHQVIEPALGSDYAAIRESVISKQSQCWWYGEVAVITRVEVLPAGKQLVVVSLAGIDAGQCMEALHNAAKATECESIRVHSNRQGMLRFLNKSGFAFKEQERIYTLDLRGE
ncbi:hypothetical protein [Agarivorans sp. DSG3-1]|uniref:hypothetical protein n=1 Tax=Agarivorans sp. DSG3-1 TaxID=3342249 RepID=UPI00398EB131